MPKKNTEYSSKLIFSKVLVVLFGLYTATASTNELDLSLKVECKGKKITLKPDELAKLKRVNIVTKNSWADCSVYEGVSIKDVLMLTGCKGDILTLHAINDYWVEVPITDIDNFEPILADTMNGKKLTLRDFGPYWFIYPIDDNPVELKKPIYGARSIWQINSILIN